MKYLEHLSPLTLPPLSWQDPNYTGPIQSDPVEVAYREVAEEPEPIPEPVLPPEPVKADLELEDVP